MTPQSAALMADYNRWMNQRMYEAACTLPEAELTKDRGAFFGSILQTLNHIAVGDTVWLHRFSQHPQMAYLQTDLLTFPQPVSLRQEIASSMEDLCTYRHALDEVIVRWSRTLTTEQLASTLSYRNMAGQASSKVYGHVIQHFFNHQTHHRGQVSTLLFQAGVDVGVTDLLAIVPNESGVGTPP